MESATRSPPSAGLRQRLLIGLGSLFVLWHTMVIVIGCAPPSYTLSQIYPLFRPYIELLHLDGRWGFFAPDPTAGRVVRYAVEDAHGRRHPFRFTEALRRADPAYLRYTTLSAAVQAEYPHVMDSVAQQLCRRHTALGPRRITFTLAHQIRIRPEDHEAGHRPLDADFLKLEDLPAVECQA